MNDDYRQGYVERDPREHPSITIKSFSPVEQVKIKGESEQLVKDYLGMIKGQFYGDDEKRFFQDRKMLLRTITLPARALWKKGVFLDDSFYRRILDDVIGGIKRHSKAKDYGSFAGYVLVCMQRHLKHHEEEYIAKGTDIREGRASRTAKNIISGLQTVETAEQFTQALTDLSHLLSAKKAVKKPAKPCPPQTPVDNQLDLL